MNSSWGWSSPRMAWTERGSERWFHPFVVATPWISLGVLVLMLYFAGNALTAQSGVLFDLPQGDADEGVRTSLVALVMPTKRETLVFFDDARYVFGDPASRDAFRRELSERAAKLSESTLLVLADRRTNAEILMALASDAKSAGMKRILFAEKSQENTVE